MQNFILICNNVLDNIRNYHHSILYISILKYWICSNSSDYHFHPYLVLERSLALTYISWKPRSPFWITEIEGPLLTYDQMSDNNLLSCTNSLVTIMVVINHRNIPRGPRCLQLCYDPYQRLHPESPFQWKELRGMHVLEGWLKRYYPSYRL